MILQDLISVSSYEHIIIYDETEKYQCVYSGYLERFKEFETEYLIYRVTDIDTCTDVFVSLCVTIKKGGN